MRMEIRTVRGTVVRRPLPHVQRHPLSGVRLGGRCPHHEVQRRAAASPVTGQGDGEAGPQAPVGGDPGHVPAEQIGRESAQICTDTGGDIGAVAVAHGAQIEVYVDPGGGTGPRPVTGRTARGRGLDHGQWHGVLAYALPHQQVGGNLLREVMCHQHSPCADDSSDPKERKVFIAGIVTTPKTICQSLSNRPSAVRPSAYVPTAAHGARPAKLSTPSNAPSPAPRISPSAVRGPSFQQGPGRTTSSVSTRDGPPGTPSPT